MISIDTFVVVIEGVDKTGKSSLARGLHAALGWPVEKFGPPRGDAAREYLAALRQAGPFIADRFHLGESVYGPIYRGTQPMHPWSVRQIEEALMRRGALLVLMTDDPADISRRFNALGEDFAKVEHVAELVRRFDELWERSVLPRVRLRWTDRTVQLVLDVVDGMTR
jgi:hypothetical protein